MGYASSVTGRAAHEALLARQDAELRLMETMKRCLLAKMKSDREYALALSAAAAQGQKMDKCEELNGSVIASAWRTMTEEWESTSRLIRANAEALESRALDRLTTLMTERRKARKTYQEDHSRISTQFTQCQTVAACGPAKKPVLACSGLSHSRNLYPAQPSAAAATGPGPSSSRIVDYVKSDV